MQQSYLVSIETREVYKPSEVFKIYDVQDIPETYKTYKTLAINLPGRGDSMMVELPASCNRAPEMQFS